MFHRTRVFVAALSVAGLALAGAALATPSRDFTSDPLARGSAGPLHAKHDGISLTTRDHLSADVAVATVTIKPGGSSGWHHHPGVVVVVVKSGTVTFYDDDCHPQVHPAGSTFVEADNGPGLATNLGTEDAVVEATYIVPSSTPPAPPTPLRVDDPQPEGCNVS